MSFFGGSKAFEDTLNEVSLLNPWAILKKTRGCHLKQASRSWFFKQKFFFSKLEKTKITIISTFKANNQGFRPTSSMLSWSLHREPSLKKVHRLFLCLRDEFRNTLLLSKYPLKHQKSIYWRVKFCQVTGKVWCLCSRKRSSPAAGQYVMNYIA